MKREYAEPFFYLGGEHGCLLIHGFTGSPGQMRFLGEKLRDEGYTVLAPRLPGHGATREAMRESNWLQWLDEARGAYQNLRAQCETVSVIGLSMGGLLALILAEEYPVDSLVCLSAALRLKERSSVFAPLIAPFLPYRRSEWPKDIPPREDFLGEYDFAYEDTPVARVYDLRKLSRLARRDLFAVIAPALVIQPIHDESVDNRSGQMIVEGISSKEKELVMLERSTHVCTLDCERMHVLSLILKHLRHIHATKPLVQSRVNHV